MAKGRVFKESNAHGRIWGSGFLSASFLKAGICAGTAKKGRLPETYSEAVACILEREELDHGEGAMFWCPISSIRNGKLPHTCDSEFFSVGGMDNVDIGPFLEFDYAALGHLHRAQQVRDPDIRYCGTLQNILSVKRDIRSRCM